MSKLDSNNKWLNPQEFNNNDEFMRAYNIMWARAKVVTEIHKMVDEAFERSKLIQKRIDEENVKNTTPARSR